MSSKAKHDPKTCARCKRDRRFITRATRPEFETGADPVVLVDLFAGCGGMSLGVAEAARSSRRAFHCILAVDFDEQATAVYRRNFPRANARSASVEELIDGKLGAQPTPRERALLDSLVSANGAATTPVDFLIGGPPCQGHSDLNNHSRRNDPRNQLYVRMARAAELFNPRAVLIENVPAVRHSTEGVVDSTASYLESRLGYSVAHEVIDVSTLGVPQVRRRHILLALRDGHDARSVLAAAQSMSCPPRTVGWAIGDLRALRGGSAFDTASKASPENEARMAWFFKDSKNRFDLPNELRPDCHRLKAHSYKSVYGRLRWDRPSQTITTGFSSMGQGRYVHPGRPRTITPHEAARLQSFPDFFDFGPERRSVWSKLIGNAVPPFLTKALGVAILAAWKDSGSQSAEPSQASSSSTRSRRATGPSDTRSHDLFANITID